MRSHGCVKYLSMSSGMIVLIFCCRHHACCAAIQLVLIANYLIGGPSGCTSCHSSAAAKLSCCYVDWLIGDRLLRGAGAV